MNEPININEASFERAVIQSPIPVVVGVGIREEQVRQDGRSVLSSLAGLAALGGIVPSVKTLGYCRL